VKLSRTDPERVINLLQRLEKLYLNGELIAPKAMTAKGRDQLVRKLSELPN